eukprot:5982565-Lingulodinium_polyedra.AAC.1
MHVPHSILVRAWSARAHAICEPLQLQAVDTSASMRSVRETLRSDAIESTVCRRSGLQVARVRIPGPR